MNGPRAARHEAFIQTESKQTFTCTSNKLAHFVQAEIHIEMDTVTDRLI